MAFAAFAALLSGLPALSACRRRGCLRLCIALGDPSAFEQWETPKPGWSQRGAAVNLPGRKSEFW